MSKLVQPVPPTNEGDTKVPGVERVPPKPNCCNLSYSLVLLVVYKHRP